MTVPNIHSHSRARTAVFAFKRAILQIKRTLDDLPIGLSRALPAAALEDLTVVIAEERSPPWTEESLAERSLQQGKVENLRVALRKLDGVLLPAGELFSFWKQIGPPVRSRGFVTGRELREGCLVPAIGGGLCQLSNALYVAALASGCEIVERHAHSQVVPGSAAAAGRDATVAYNYVDLRFRSDIPIRIEAHLTADELIVRFRATAPRPDSTPPRPRRRLELLTPPVGSCVSCGEEGCYRHVPALSAEPVGTAYLLFTRSPDILRYLDENCQPADTLLIPLDGHRWRLLRYAWPTAGYACVQAATLPALQNLLATKLQRSRKPAAVRERQRLYAANIAHVYARRLRPQDTHLVVDQDLLPTLWIDGALGGRTFDVLMYRPPLVDLHAALDSAHARWPQSPTLGDYRAPAEAVRAESEALAAARHLLTNHPELRHAHGNRSLPLTNTTNPQTTQRHRQTRGRHIVFPGPTIGRKGCYELRSAALELNLPLRLLGRNLETNDFWHNVLLIPASPDEDPLAEAAVVVLPSLWEAQPSPLLLRALSLGIPVVTTPGGGLDGRDGVTTVPFGDVAALRAALELYAPARTIE